MKSDEFHFAAENGNRRGVKQPLLAERVNARLAKPARRSVDLHRALKVEPYRLRDILRLRDQRYVGRQLTVSYERKRIMLKESDAMAPEGHDQRLLLFAENG